MKAEKSRILLILRYLYRSTCEDRSVSTRDIKRMLEAEGIKRPDTRTIDHDIDLLMEAGHDILRQHSNGQSCHYRVRSRLFEPAELKLLIDAVSASRFVSPGRSEDLIRRLASFADPRYRDALSAEIENVPKIKQMLGGTIVVANELMTAVLSGVRVRFKMIDYAAPDKRRVLRHEGKVYELSPYALVWSNDRYYLIGHEAERGCIIMPRIEHIVSVEITDIPIQPRPDDFDIGYYYASAYKMFSGPEHEITLECKNALLGKFIDRFGAEFECVPAGEDAFRATVRAAVGPTFYGWLFQYGGDIRLIGPEDVRADYLAHLERVMIRF